MKLDLSALHTPYFAKDGTRLTGVTTILGNLNKVYLPPWYARMEREGVLAYTKSGRPLPVKKDGKPLWFAEAKRDKAADLGTITHFRAEAWLKGVEAETDGIPPDLWSQSKHGLDRFVEWWEEQRLTLLDSEKVVIHDDTGLRYGGTADVLAVDQSVRKVLIDLKTSKASPFWPYDEVFGQVTAYAVAEEFMDKSSVDRIIVARIGKEPDDVLQTVELTQKQRDAGWRLFCAAYDAHNAKRDLEAARK